MVVLFRRYTIGKLLTCTPYARDKRVFPGEPACLSYTMASIEAVDHADAHLLLRFPDGVRAGTRSGGAHSLEIPLCLYSHTFRK